MGADVPSSWVLAPPLPGVARTSQPQSPVAIDWGNPFAASLIACTLPHNRTWNPLGGSVTLFGTSGVAASAQGIGYSWAGGGAAQGVEYPSSSKFGAGSSRLAVIVPRSSGTSTISTSDGTIVTGSAQWRLNALKQDILNSGSALLLTSNTTLTLNQPVVVGFSVGSTADGTPIRLYTNGVEDTATASAGTWTPNTAKPSLGFRYSDYSEGFVGDLLLHLWWGRVLRPAEYLEISKNPWQLFANDY